MVEPQNLLPQSFDLELFTIPDEVAEPIEKSVNLASNYRVSDMGKSNINELAPRQRRMTIARKNNQEIQRTIKKPSENLQTSKSGSNMASSRLGKTQAQQET